MIIRKIRIDDVPEVVNLTRQFYAEMKFHEYGYQYDPLTVAETFIQAVIAPEGFIILVAEENNRVVGVIGATVQAQRFYSKGHKYAIEHIWHSDPALLSIRRGKVMISLMHEMIAQKGDMPLYLASDIRPEFASVGKWLKKKGAKKITDYWYIE